jgi:thiamine pyrophosphate-dependent acetolactate synthase large subunit-like protein
MVVWDNGIYQITGSQPTASNSTADLVAIARGSGLANSAWAADEDEFDPLLARALKDGGPSLIAARIDSEPGVGKTDRDPVQIRVNFMRGIGAKKQL